MKDFLTAVAMQHHASRRACPGGLHGGDKPRRSLSVALIAQLLLALPTTLVAQGPSSEPPLAGRPAQFSNIVGSYTIRADVEPAQVPVEEPITLRVTLAGRGPAKYQPERKHLKIFPDAWSKDFYVEPVPGEDRLLPEEGAWIFVYRLRPKHEQITAIDGIKLVYYQPPTSKALGRFQTTYAEPIAITVKPRQAKELSNDLPLRTAPDSFFELPDSAAVLTPWPMLPTVPQWLICLVLLAPPLVAVAGVRCWRALAPAGHARRNGEHSHAARRALKALQAAEGMPVWVVWTAYLRERLDFPAEEPTPAEVRHFLRRRGVSRTVAEKLALFLGTCDAARFAGPGTAQAGSLREEASKLIGALEEDLCAP
jgi:hypothetical protein